MIWYTGRHFEICCHSWCLVFIYFVNFISKSACTLKANVYYAVDIAWHFYLSYSNNPICQGFFLHFCSWSLCNDVNCGWQVEILILFIHVSFFLLAVLNRSTLVKTTPCSIIVFRLKKKEFFCVLIEIKHFRFSLKLVMLLNTHLEEDKMILLQHRFKS